MPPTCVSPSLAASHVTARWCHRPSRVTKLGSLAEWLNAAVQEEAVGSGHRSLQG